MIRWLWPLGLALALGGCAAVPEAPLVEGRAAQAQVIAAFRLEGRISVRADEQPFSGGIVWSRNGQEERILLRTPLGQGVAEIQLAPGRAVLVDAEGRRLEAQDGETLLQQALGWSLPLSGMGRWVTGQPDASRPFTGRMDALGRWLVIEQDGWRIAFDRHAEQNGLALPGRLVARRGEALEIRLVVDAWQAQ